MQYSNLIGYGTVVCLILLNGNVSAQETGLKLIDDGKLNFSNRTRYERVDQDGFANNANALTMRNRITLTSGNQSGFQFSVEGEAITHINDDMNFNDTFNGNAAYPIVADPEEVEINQLWASFDGVEGTVVKVGRQRINLDGQRFVGGVGWRQNEQTFDAARVTNKSFDGLVLDYTYVNQVNRIFGDDSPIGQFDGDTHLLNVSYESLPIGKIVTYAYLLDFENAVAASSKTFGVSLTGKLAMSNSYSITYSAEYARQQEYKLNRANFDLDYFNFSAGVASGPAMIAVGYERLDGDGRRGFSTPLATLHKFNGFADVFLGTPAAGLEDINVTASYSWKDVGFAKSIKVQAWYHDFSSSNGPSISYGEEFDFSVTAAFEQGISAGFKFADYRSDGFSVDRNKMWFWIGFAI